MPCHESVKGYKNDPGMDHWTTVKIVLGVNKDMFLNYGGDKEFGVKGYIMQALTPIRMTLSSKPDTYIGATIWNSSKWSVEAAFTI